MWVSGREGGLPQAAGRGAGGAGATRQRALRQPLAPTTHLPRRVPPSPPPPPPCSVPWGVLVSRRASCLGCRAPCGGAVAQEAGGAGVLEVCCVGLPLLCKSVVSMHTAALGAPPICPPRVPRPPPPA